MKGLGWAVVSVLVGLVACGGAVEPAGGAARHEVPAGPLAVERTTQGGKYTLQIASEPAVPVMGELFTMKARLLDAAGEPIEDATVVMDARMPHHNHGMETDPIDDPGRCPPEGGRCVHPDGTYTTRGFKFHMGGAWTVTVDVQGPRGADNTSFVYEMQ